MEKFESFKNNLSVVDINACLSDSKLSKAEQTHRVAERLNLVNYVMAHRTSVKSSTIFKIALLTRLDDTRELASLCSLNRKALINIQKKINSYYLE